MWLLSPHQEDAAAECLLSSIGESFERVTCKREVRCERFDGSLSVVLKTHHWCSTEHFRGPNGASIETLAVRLNLFGASIEPFWDGHRCQGKCLSKTPSIYRVFLSLKFKEPMLCTPGSHNLRHFRGVSVIAAYPLDHHSTLLFGVAVSAVCVAFVVFMPVVCVKAIRLQTIGLANQVQKRPSLGNFCAALPPACAFALLGSPE